MESGTATLSMIFIIWMLGSLSLGYLVYRSTLKGAVLFGLIGVLLLICPPKITYTGDPNLPTIFGVFGLLEFILGMILSFVKKRYVNA
jgi:hypothetical protein